MKVLHRQRRSTTKKQMYPTAVLAHLWIPWMFPAFKVGPCCFLQLAQVEPMFQGSMQAVVHPLSCVPQCHNMRSGRCTWFETSKCQKNSCLKPFFLTNCWPSSKFDLGIGIAEKSVRHCDSVAENLRFDAPMLHFRMTAAVLVGTKPLESARASRAFAEPSDTM